MNFRALPLLCTLAVAAVCTTAHATLIGDTITVEYQYPTLGTTQYSTTITGQAGTGDATSFVFNTFVIDPEATTILVTFGASNNFSTFTFNGLVFSGIDDTLINVTASTNLPGWTASRLAFDAHSISVNFESLSFSNSPTLTLTLTTGNGASSTPDAGATVALLGVSLVGLFSLRRKLGVAKR